MALGRKTGGRQKGTPNKTTTAVKERIIKLLDEYQEGSMAQDFANCEPRERLQMMEKLMRYVIPTMQSTDVDITAQGEASGVADFLTKLANGKQK